MNEQNKVIEETIQYVKGTLAQDSSGHDWWHIYRVWKNAINIGRHEHADMFTVQLAALLHDIADWKFHDGDDDIGPRLAGEWLAKCGVDKKIIAHVTKIIKNISFKGSGVENKIDTLEGMIVQDADRLDAIGAIGIGRTFAYGGYMGRIMYDPAIKPLLHATFEEYRTSQSPTINHFYEKLLLLKELMHTQTAKAIAQKRHEFIERFLEKFFEEWDGQDAID
jgi:uncharacterized protein